MVAPDYSCSLSLGAISSAGQITQLTSKKTISCTSEPLSQLNTRCMETIGQILVGTEQELRALIQKIQEQVHILFQVCESVAFLDMMASFATFVRMSGDTFVRPRLDESPSASLVLKQARHPILERVAEHSLIANDVYATPAANLLLVTGPNMAGKSTYLRQTALVCLLAHVGCLVPARGANMPLLERIFTRIGSSDNLESCTSTFANEMRESTYILRSLGQPALILVDELGRGTSNRDGASLAWAVAEELLSTPRTFTLFATHYLNLANLKNLYPNVRCLMLEVEPSQSRLRFMYRVQDGVCVKRQYCTDFLAELAGIPSSVTAAARRLSEEHDFDPVDAPSAETRRRAAYAECAQRLLRIASSSTMDEATLRRFLKQLQERLRPSFPAAPVSSTPAPEPGSRGKAHSPPVLQPLSPRTTPRFAPLTNEARAAEPHASPRFAAAAEALLALQA